MKTARFGVLTLVVLLAAGCDDIFGTEVDGVRLSTTADVYFTGDTVTLRLSNDSRETVSYTLCSPHIDRRVGGEWVDIGYTSGLPCAAIMHDLRPGESVAGPMPLPLDLPTDDYRARVAVYTRDDATVHVATRPFEFESQVIRFD